MTIVNLRDINGSGKTTAARRVLAYCTETQLGQPYTNRFGQRKAGWPLHLCDTPCGLVIVHGRYDVQQGGCDTEKDMDCVERGLRWGFHQHFEAHHLFEGFIVSKSAKRFARLADDHRHMGWHCVVLNPGLDECVRRVTERSSGRVPNVALMERTLQSDIYRCAAAFDALGWCRVSHRTNINSDAEVWELF